MMTDSGFLNVANLENVWALIEESTFYTEGCLPGNHPWLMEVIASLHTHKRAERWENWNWAELHSQSGAVHGSH